MILNIRYKNIFFVWSNYGVNETDEEKVEPYKDNTWMLTKKGKFDKQW